MLSDRGAVGSWAKRECRLHGTDDRLVARLGKELTGTKGTLRRYIEYLWKNQMDSTSTTKYNTSSRLGVIMKKVF